MTDNPNHTARTEPSDRTWTVTRNGSTVAQSSSVVLVHEQFDGNEFDAVPYFPIDDVQVELVGPTGHHTTCPVKGKADYYSVRIDGEDKPELDNSIWFYPEPLSPLEPVAGHVAFYGDRYQVSAG